MSKSKTTIIALVALIVVCAGSFLGVRALNNKTPVQQPISITTQSTTTVPSTTEPTTVPTTESTTAPSTMPTTGLAVNGVTDGTSNLFTTFAQNSVSAATTETTTKPSTTAPTTRPSTTAPTTSKEQEAEEVIKSAAVFSDGFLGYKYDADGDVYFTDKDPWQRNFGFNELYDVGASFIVFYYDTVRCKFNYANKDWMIQFWKGQYGFVFVGAEIGVYTKPTTRKVEHYDCASDEDSLQMSMTCYRKGKEIFSRKYATYWWCTGFVPGKLDKFSDRSELTVKCRITMKDAKMLLAFCVALEQNGFKINKNYTVSGLDVFITWQ
ncbi:MAG: DUF4474 domain-containing protein [Clostridia bacterium]|nr:DUF4474 domain-containing protein [Clostridia bacterium]